MRKVLILLTVFMTGLTVCCSEPHKHTRIDGFNVLLITIDTLRADHLSCYGYNRETSPTFDSVAREGVFFLNTIAQRGLTWPSLTSIQTSLYPQTHGVRNNGEKLDASKLTIAELLHERGYLTAAFLSNMLNAPNRGFDFKFLAKENRDEQVTDATIKWLRENNKKTFFAWVHYIAPHKPYTPPSPYNKMFGNEYSGSLDGTTEKIDEITLNKVELSDEDLNHIVSLYDGEIAYIDGKIKNILDELDKLDLSDSTLVVLSADHGEELYQRNNYFYHGCSIYDSVLRVPLIMKLPNVLPENKKINSVVETIDIAPTIFELLSVPIPRAFEGKSLRSLIFPDKGDELVLSIAYSEIRDKVASIRTDRWRYIYNPFGFFPDGAPYKFVDDERQYGYVIEKEELYDLAADPNESINLINRDGKLAAELNRQLLKWFNQEKTKYQQQTLDEQTLEELKSLGYIQ